MRLDTRSTEFYLLESVQDINSEHVSGDHTYRGGVVLQLTSRLK